MRDRVRRFLARGRLARLSACLVVAFAAVVWVAVASLVLRVIFVSVLVLLVTWCVLLIVGVWLGETADTGKLGRLAWSFALSLRHAVARPEAPRMETEVVSRGLSGEDEELGRRERELAEREAEFASVRSSVDAVVADLLGRQQRLHTDAEQLQDELAGQIEAMRVVVARMGQLEQGVAQTVVSAQPRPREPEPTVLDQPAELNLYAARAELEADLRLEKVEQQEQLLLEREEQLLRREQQLANFVAQAQSQLNPQDAERPRLSALQ